MSGVALGDDVILMPFSAGRVRVPPHELRLHLCARAHVRDRLEFFFLKFIDVSFLLARAYLAELICAKARPAHVRFECVWTALMSIFQLGDVWSLLSIRLC